MNKTQQIIDELNEAKKKFDSPTAMCIIVQPTSWRPYYFHSGNAEGCSWTARHDLAQHFKRDEAQQITDQLNASRETHKVYIEPI